MALTVEIQFRSCLGKFDSLHNGSRTHHMVLMNIQWPMGNYCTRGRDLEIFGKFHAGFTAGIRIAVSLMQKDRHYSQFAADRLFLFRSDCGAFRFTDSLFNQSAFAPGEIDKMNPVMINLRQNQCKSQPRINVIRMSIDKINIFL